MAQLDRAWIPRFLTEPNVRIFLQSLFVAIVNSGENCNLLLNTAPGEITWNKTRGNILARKCLLGASRWLELARENSESDSLFQSQLLGPARVSAQFMHAIRELPHPTTSIRGLVFAKSPAFFDAHYSSIVTSLSIIVPLLKRTLSLRCRPELLGAVRSGLCELRGVQPVPFINRVHPVRLTTSKESGKVPLSSLDFLKLSLFDVEGLTHSLTFENSSEVQSTEAGIRRLGVTGILGVILLHVQQPFLIVQSCVDSNLTARILISPEMVEDFGGNPKYLRKLEGKPVRILCTAWYEPRKGARPSLEGFALEPAEKISDITEDDILGYVRVRRRVTRETLIARFRTQPSRSASLTEADGSFEWARQPKNGTDVAAEFSKCDGVLADFRASAHGVWLASPEQVFGKDRLSLTSVGERISRDTGLLKCANIIVRTRDFTGTLPATWRELRREIAKIEPELKDPRAWWFRLMGLVSKEDAGLTLTHQALEVVRRANDQNLSKVLNQLLHEGGKILSLIELERSTPFPPSIILHGLGMLARDGKLVRAKSELLWSKPPLLTSDLSGEEAKLEQLAAKVLSILQSVSHSLGTLKIVEVLGERGESYSVFTIGIFLDWMKTRRLVTETESGMWFYPWRDRILNVILARPQNYYSENQLATLISLPPAAREEIRQILADLVREKVVDEVLPSNWGARLDEKGTQERNRMMMEQGLASHIRTSFQGRRMHYEGLVRRVEDIILTRLSPSERAGVNHRLLARKLIKDMISSSEITQEGLFLRIK